MLEHDFDALIKGRNAAMLGAIVDYAIAVDARRVEIVGSQGDILLSDGSVLAEREGLARARAEQAAEVLRVGGLPAAQAAVSWRTAPPPDGVEDWAARRTLVTVAP